MAWVKCALFSSFSSNFSREKSSSLFLSGDLKQLGYFFRTHSEPLYSQSICFNARIFSCLRRAALFRATFATCVYVPRTNILSKDCKSSSNPLSFLWFNYCNFTLTTPEDCPQSVGNVGTFCEVGNSHHHR